MITSVATSTNPEINNMYQRTLDKAMQTQFRAGPPRTQGAEHGAVDAKPSHHGVDVKAVLAATSPGNRPSLVEKLGLQINNSSSQKLVEARAAVSELYEAMKQIDDHAKGREFLASEQRDFDALRNQYDRARADLDRAEEAHRKEAEMAGREFDAERYGSADKWQGSAAEAVMASVHRARQSSGGAEGYGRVYNVAVEVPSPYTQEIVEVPAEPANVLDLLVDRTKVEGNEYAFMRETVRTSLAGPVADGEVKPTSTYDFEDVPDRLRVYAHLSNALPLRLLEDRKEVARVLSTQMTGDLQRAIEHDVVNGDGTGEHLTGILNTSGVVVQSFATDVLTTLRKAITSTLQRGEHPTAWVVNYADVEQFDLMREDATSGGFLAGLHEKVFASLPIVGTSAVPEGTAVLGDWKQVRLFARDSVQVAIDATGELFEKNQWRMRTEIRVGLGVLRPGAFTQVALSGA